MAAQGTQQKTENKIEFSLPQHMSKFKPALSIVPMILEHLPDIEENKAFRQELTEELEALDSKKINYNSTDIDVYKRDPFLGVLPNLLPRIPEIDANKDLRTAVTEQVTLRQQRSGHYGAVDTFINRINGLIPSVQYFEDNILPRRGGNDTSMNSAIEQYDAYKVAVGAIEKLNETIGDKLGAKVQGKGY